jgi:hypothetical protein
MCTIAAALVLVASTVAAAAELETTAGDPVKARAARRRADAILGSLQSARAARSRPASHPG